MKNSSKPAFLKLRARLKLWRKTIAKQLSEAWESAAAIERAIAQEKERQLKHHPWTLPWL